MNGMKGVAMSAGRHWIKEFYVGFLLLVLSFLYLSHLTAEYRQAELEDELLRLRHDGIAGTAHSNRPATSSPRSVL